MTDRRRYGCYPGTFNPPTIAHLAVAEAALAVGGLDRIHLVVSRIALGKEDLSIPTLADRVALLRDVAATRSWLGVVVSEAHLIADLAAGYGAVVMGADKWRQVNDPEWYGNEPRSRDAALLRLPKVLLAPRAGDDLADLPARADRVTLLPFDADHAEVSASAARQGRPEARSWMLPEAVAFDHRTNAWSDPGRYRPLTPPH